MSRFVSGHTLVVLAASMFMVAISAQAQTTWYVDDDAPSDPGPGDPTVSDPLEDGTADHPFDAIQEGIDAAANGDTVLVLDGTYTGTENRNLDFGGKPITVRSENGPETCIIDCEGSGRGFYFHSGETSASVLEGVTIYDGNGIADSGYGGGVCCEDFSSPTLANCTITANGAFFGGGVGCDYSSPTLTNCTISANRAFFGGGVACDVGDATITNCTITANTADGGGGGVTCSFSSPTLTNCTISANTADRGDGLWCGDANATLTNCILWNDSSGEIHVYSGNVPIVTYCDVLGGWPGVGNICADPLFVDPNNGDLHLSPGSPCIDAGDNTTVPPEIITDLDGNPRFVDDTGMPDDGFGTSPIVDMGAYEFQGETCFGDLDGDQDIDLDDLTMLLANYRTTGTVYTEGDLDRDGDVDLGDLAALLAVYRTTCP